MDTPPPPHPQGVPGVRERDFVGASHSSLVDLLRSLSADELHEALIATVEEHGATHNQRVLFEAAAVRVVREQVRRN